MACFVPFNSRNLDISFFAFKPMVVLVDELVEALNRFSLCTETLGCVHSAIFRSIHGNMIIWYGAWMKRSNEKESLRKTLTGKQKKFEKKQKTCDCYRRAHFMFSSSPSIVSLSQTSMLKNVSTMAILMDHSFFDAYAGESRDGTPAAKFCPGDTISMNAVLFTDDGVEDLSYACLAVFRSRFAKMDGVVAGVCLKCQSKPRMVNLFVWKSLQCCYSWILTADYRNTVLPYLGNVPLEVKYDVFRVVCVSGDNNALSDYRPVSENGMESKEGSRMSSD